jgi:hypothetical protein
VGDHHSCRCRLDSPVELVEEVLLRMVSQRCCVAVGLARSADLDRCGVETMAVAW